jgi:hypothetical protein
MTEDGEINIAAFVSDIGDTNLISCDVMKATFGISVGECATSTLISTSMGPMPISTAVRKWLDIMGKTGSQTSADSLMYLTPTITVPVRAASVPVSAPSTPASAASMPVPAAEITFVPADPTMSSAAGGFAHVSVPILAEFPNPWYKDRKVVDTVSVPSAMIALPGTHITEKHMYNIAGRLLKKESSVFIDDFIKLALERIVLRKSNDDDELISIIRSAITTKASEYKYNISLQIVMDYATRCVKIGCWYSPCINPNCKHPHVDGQHQPRKDYVKRNLTPGGRNSPLR